VEIADTPEGNDTEEVGLAPQGARAEVGPRADETDRRAIRTPSGMIAYAIDEKTVHPMHRRL
jgi:hypothetical protein